jgi:thymidylate synthase
MSLAAQKTRLTSVTQELFNRWHETQEHWRDAKCQEFGRLYMDELSASVTAAAGVIDQLDKVIAKIRRDCE